MGPYLPNTNITSLQSALRSTATCSLTTEQANQTNIGLTVRYRGDDDEDEEDVPSHVPKMFTPLAAASLGETRYVMYVNDDNIIQDIIFKDGEWQKGELCNLEDVNGKTGIRCAPYSKLAAATVNVNDQDIICLYYQVDGKNGPVRMISFLPGDGWQTVYNSDGTFTAEFTAELNDPPLYGTSMTAVKPREGIIVAKDEQLKQLPVVYLQWDTHALAEGQGSKIQEIPGLEEFQLSPHTSLTTVDDGSNLYCLYKSNDSTVRMVRIADNKAEEVLHDVVVPTPRSYIAAVMPLQHKDRIVVFYQYWGHGKGEKVDIKAKILSKDSNGVWEITTETNVLSG